MYRKKGSPKDTDQDDNAGDEKRYDHNESEDLFLQGSHACLRLVRKCSNTTKDGIITSSHAYTDAATRNTVCSLHANVLCLEIVFFGQIGSREDGF